MTEKQASLQSTVETMYRFTADDYIREEIRAREDELRLQRTIELEIKEQKAKLAEQKATIAEQLKQLSDKDMEIARLKAALAEKK